MQSTRVKLPASRQYGGPRVGLALGSGSARGWAHIGVIRALQELGIEAQVIAGSSIGSIVGAAYALDQLDLLEEWVRSLNTSRIIKFFDLSLLRGGGMIQGEKLYEFARTHVQDTTIESLPHRFAAVATDLENGREVWFREGSLVDAVRASIALPGLFSPMRLNDRWLVDGGLTNPVPVSLCRAMDAEVIIAVKLNGDIVGKHTRQRRKLDAGSNDTGEDGPAFLDRISRQLKHSLSETTDELWFQLVGEDPETPGMFEVLASSINIMQDRITRSRMGGDPPEVIVTPRLAELGLMDFDRADVAIEEGRAAVQRMRPALEQVLMEAG